MSLIINTTSPTSSTSNAESNTSPASASLLSTPSSSSSSSSSANTSAVSSPTSSDPDTELESSAKRVASKSVTFSTLAKQQDVEIYQEIFAQVDNKATFISDADEQNANAQAKITRPDAHQKIAGMWWTAALFIFLSHLVILWMIYQQRTASWSIMLYAVFQGWIQIIAVNVGAHRLWSHRSFKATLPLRIFLAITQLQSFQGSAAWWAQRHRLHHRFNDTDSDPYNAKFGFFYAHIGWLFLPPPKFEKMRLIGSQDLNQDPVVVFQRKYLLLGYIIWGAIYPAVLGQLFDQDPSGGLLWIGVVARFISWHCIWSVNSFAHWKGSKEYSSSNTTAVHSWFTGFMLQGEQHHSYHHAYPSDYRAGIKTFDYEPTKWFIYTCSILGLAYDLKTTPTRDSEALRAHILRQEAASIELEQKLVSKVTSPLSSLPLMTRAEFKCLCKEKKLPWLIVNDLILDVSTFDTHPAGDAIVRAYYGQDATEAVTGKINKHTDAAHFLMQQYAIAQVKEEEETDTKKKK